MRISEETKVRIIMLPIVGYLFHLLNNLILLLQYTFTNSTFSNIKKNDYLIIEYKHKYDNSYIELLVQVDQLLTDKSCYPYIIFKKTYGTRTRIYNSKHNNTTQYIDRDFYMDKFGNLNCSDIYCRFMYNYIHDNIYNVRYLNLKDKAKLALQ